MAPTQANRTDPGRDPTAAAGTDDLAHRIEAHVAGKARVRDLRVAFVDNVIILQGRARTHHDKQLAQEAALALAGDRMVLANQIIVQ